MREDIARLSQNFRNAGFVAIPQVRADCFEVKRCEEDSRFIMIYAGAIHYWVLIGEYGRDNTQRYFTNVALIEHFTRRWLCEAGVDDPLELLDDDEYKQLMIRFMESIDPIV
jgi:hypothetical protein